jgi:hypothetical protein
MSTNPTPKPKLLPIDWVVLIGGPAAFLLIAYFGITAFLGPAPPPNPIAAIRDQKVKVGQSWSEASQHLGQPITRVDYPDGSFLLRFTRTDWTSVTKDRNATLMQDDGIVEVGPDGRVRSARVERIPVPDTAPTTNSP